MKRILLVFVLALTVIFSSLGRSARAADCPGVCADVYVGGCTFICQQYSCEYPGGIVIEYSVTTAICGDNYYVFPPDYGYNCPCHQ